MCITFYAIFGAFFIHKLFTYPTATFTRSFPTPKAPYLSASSKFFTNSQPLRRLRRISSKYILYTNHFIQKGSYTHHENHLFQKQPAQKRKHITQGSSVQNYHADSGVHFDGCHYQPDKIYHQRYGTGDRNNC